MKKILLTMTLLTSLNSIYASETVASTGFLAAGTGALAAGAGSLVNACKDIRDPRVLVQKERAKQELRIVKAQNKLLKELDRKDYLLKRLNKKIRMNKNPHYSYKYQIQKKEIETDIINIKTEFKCISNQF